MNTKNIFAFFLALAFSCTLALAQGPGGESGGTSGGPGGESGGESGGPGGESGGPGGGDAPGGGGGSFTYDEFLSITTNADCTLERDGLLYGYTDALAATVTGGSDTATLAPGVFAGNTAITAVDLSGCSSLTAIPDDCFAGCTALESVALPTDCASIGANAFAGCTALSSVSMSGVQTIGSDAFRGCAALAGVTLSSVTAIGDYAFAQSGLTAASAASATLGEGVFAGCESLTGATLGVTSLPAATFSGCTALEATDWSGYGEFGAAALAGIPATNLTFASSATLGDYACAAEAATVATTLDGDVPSYADTAFLGREMSLVVNGGDVVRIEANELVEWLMSIADGSTVLETSSVSQPTDDEGNVCYSTDVLEAWIADFANREALLAFCYADGIDGAAVLAVDGNTFTCTATERTSVAVTLEGTYSMDEEFSAGNLTVTGPVDSIWSATAADESATSCFARFVFEKAW